MNTINVLLMYNNFCLFNTQRLDDDDDALNGYDEPNEIEYFVKIREEKVYTIPDKLFERINLILSVFVE